MRRWLRFHHAALAGLLALACSSASLGAQVIRGIAVDSVTREPIEDAVVSLLDSTADVVSVVRTSNRGRFQLRLHDGGYFAVDVRAIGFKPHTSGWIPLATTDTVDVTVRVVRNATLLSRVTVNAERDEIGERSFMGMKIKTISGKIITPSEVLATRGSARDYIEVLQASLPAGFAVSYLDVRINKRCIVNTRNGQCVTIFVDGMRVLNAEQAIDLAPPELIDHVLILRAIEAGTLFGGDGDAGAILIFRKGYAGGPLSPR